MVGGKVVVKPGEVIEGATIVIRDAFIEAVGKEVTPPADARVWEMKGATIYAGFIDACLTLDSTNRPVTTTKLEFESAAAAGGVNFFGVPGGGRDRGAAGPGYEVARVTPEARHTLVDRDYSVDRGGEVSRRSLRDDAERLELLAATFGLSFPVGTIFRVQATA